MDSSGSMSMFTDEYYDCYICPANKILNYSTTNREGYREYKSNCRDCESCPCLSQCTESKNHVKLIQRHIWEPYMETAEDIRHTLGMKALYDQRKETIERIFGTAKEYHGFRYTNMIGNARMTMKAALTFSCINLKKLARKMGGIPSFFGQFRRLLHLLLVYLNGQNKMVSALAC